jgi:hypothetical protein
MSFRLGMEIKYFYGIEFHTTRHRTAAVKGRNICLSFILFSALRWSSFQRTINGFYGDEIKLEKVLNFDKEFLGILF